MTRIILEKCYGPLMDPITKKINPNAYLGNINIDTENMTPKFIAGIKRDENKLGKERVKKYLKILKEKGYDIGEEEPE